jgi:protein tyrosine phosphatase (PTP) superfamily phosphohydrolase (DUF442 family)
MPAPPADAQPWAAPGIRTFSGVGPQLAAGSFPEQPGWEYLAQKGYKTVLDLRDISQVRPDDLAEIHHRGLRHVMLPLPIDQIDPATFKRFQEEIELAGARPLYFCDADGSRAAALWYAHRIVTDKVDHSLARRDAEIVGPLTPEARAKAEALTALPSIPLPAITPSPSPEPAAAASNPPADSPEAAASASNPAPDPAAPPAEVPTASADLTSNPLASTDDPPVRDPRAWRPYAALFLSILVIPLAYWSSGTLSVSRREKAPASLEARERKLRSLPPGSRA